MRAFDKMVEITKRSPQYGHILINVRNIITLTDAKNELEKMLKQNKKGEF